MNQSPIIYKFCFSSNKRKKENFENIQILLNATKVAIKMLENTRYLIIEVCP